MMSEAVAGLAEACRAFDVPVVGGNVSLYNESPTGAIDPTPTVAIAGVVDRREYVTTQTLKTGDEALFLLGGWPHELGGSYFLGVRHGLKTGDAPAVDFEAEKKLHNFVRAQIRTGRVVAAHDLAEGGLLVALSEMLFAAHKTFGAELDVRAAKAAAGGKYRLDALLFGESQGRIILAVKPEYARALPKAAEAAGVPVVLLGEGQGEAILKVVASAPAGEGSLTVTWPVGKLRETWTEAIPKAMA
jgi:phosphoribosylformylglycinamidine synthase